MFWVDAVVCRNRGGGRPADIAGFLPQGAHGLVMLFGQVVVTFQVPAPRKAQLNTRVSLYRSRSPSESVSRRAARTIPAHCKSTLEQGACPGLTLTPQRPHEHLFFESSCTIVCLKKENNSSFPHPGGYKCSIIPPLNPGTQLESSNLGTSGKAHLQPKHKQISALNTHQFRIKTNVKKLVLLPSSSRKHGPEDKGPFPHLSGAEGAETVVVIIIMGPLRHPCVSGMSCTKYLRWTHQSLNNIIPEFTPAHVSVGVLFDSHRKPFKKTR